MNDKPNSAERRIGLIADFLLVGWVLLVLVSFGFSAAIHPLLSCPRDIADFLGKIRPGIGFAPQLAFSLVFPVFCVLLGRSLLTRIRETMPKVQRLPTYFGAGVGAIGLTMFFLGALHLWNRNSISLSALGLFGILLFLNRDLIQVFRDHQKDAIYSAKAMSFPKMMFALILTLLTAFVILASLTPEVFYDSMVYHLALPQLYFLEGGFVRTPSCSFSGMPSLVEMVFALSMAVCGEGGARLTIPAFFIFSGLSIRAFVSHGLSPLKVLLAALIFFSTPVTLFAALKSTVEIPWAMFTILATLHLFNAFTRKPSRSSLILAGVFYGFAMSSKYVAWPYLIAFSALSVIGLALSSPSRADGDERKASLHSWILRLLQGLRYTIPVILTAMIVISPWVIRNLLDYSNPVHPLGEKIFSRFDTRGDVHLKERFSGNRSLSGGLRTAIADPVSILTAPWEMTMKGENESTMPGLVFLMLLPWLLFYRKADFRPRLLALFALGLWLLFFLMHNYARYFIPGFAILSLITADAALGVGSRYARRLTGALVIILCLSQSALVFHEWKRTGAWVVFEPQKTISDYLKHSHPLYPSPYFETARWIDDNLPDDAMLLIVGDARGLYYYRRFRASSQHDRQLFIVTLDHSNSAAELYRRLHEQGFTHLVFNYAEMSRLFQTFMPELTDLSMRQRSILTDFWKNHLEEVHLEYADSSEDHRFVLVYRISEASRKPARNLYLEFVRKVHPLPSDEKSKSATPPVH